MSEHVTSLSVFRLTLQSSETSWKLGSELPYNAHQFPADIVSVKKMGGNDQSKPVPKFPPVEESSPRQRGRRSPVRTTVRLRHSSPITVKRKASKSSQSCSSSSSAASGSFVSARESISSCGFPEPHNQSPQGAAHHSPTAHDHGQGTVIPELENEGKKEYPRSTSVEGSNQSNSTQRSLVAEEPKCRHGASGRAVCMEHTNQVNWKKESLSTSVTTSTANARHEPIPTNSESDTSHSTHSNVHGHRRVQNTPEASHETKMLCKSTDLSSSDDLSDDVIRQESKKSLSTGHPTTRQSYEARFNEHDISRLLEILGSHAYKWKMIGLALGFTPGELVVIQSKPLNLSSGPEMWLVDMLNKWVQWSPEMGSNPRPYASLESLEEALQKPTVGLGVVAENLRQMFKGKQPETENIPEPVSAGPSQPPVQKAALQSEGTSIVHSRVSVPIPPNPSASPFEHYGFYLRSYYSQHEQPDDKFPHLEPKKYIEQNLAVISNKYDNEQEFKEFQKATVHGSIDDIVEAKAPIDFPDILQPVDSSSPALKTLLIEGAPGTGKSVMSQRVCQSWGKGEHFQQYELVVMLRFRDSWVQKVQNVSDLFRFPRDWLPESQRDVVTQIKQSQGQGVLFILDGYDEAPSSLRNADSIFYELYTGSLLPNATVMVTTRPSASESLRKRCRGKSSRRIEVLGFSRNEIDEYIESHISDSGSQRNFHKYLELYPHIRSMMYIPLNSAIVTTVYQSCKKTSDVVPKTMTQLYTALVKILLLRYLDEKGYNDCVINTFDDFPQSVLETFRKVCQRAYDGIIKPEIEIIFTDLPAEFDSLGLMQSSPELYIDKGALHSHTFLHLTIQEFLAAYHLSQLSEEEQVSFLKSKMESRVAVSKFVAGLTNLSGPVCKVVWDIHNNSYMPSPEFSKYIRDNIDSPQYPSSCQSRVSDCVLHMFFELQDPVALTSALGSQTLEYRYSGNAGLSKSKYSFVFDCYVLGYCIGASSCKWEVGLYLDNPECVDFLVKGMTAFESATPRVTVTSRITKLEINYSSHGHASQLDLKPLCTAPRHIFQDMTYLILSEVCPQVCFIQNQMLSMLQVLDIGDVREIAPDSVATLLKCLPHSLTTLKLRGIEPGIGEESCKALRDVLASSNYGIEHLDITSSVNSIPTTSVQHIIDGLTQNTSLKHLCVALLSFNSTNIARLTSVLQTNTTLTDLDLRNCGIDDDALVSLSSSLEENRTLRKLDLSNTNTFAISYFVNRCYLGNGPNRNSFTSRGITTLCSALSAKNTQLTSLRLEHCNVQNRDTIQLANALKNNSILESLSLRFNRIGDEGAIALADMLKLNSTLKYLTLEQNNIGNEGAIALVDMLKLNPRSALQTLNLKNNQYTIKCCDQLEDSGQQMKTLVELTRVGTTPLYLTTSVEYRHYSRLYRQ